MRIATADLAPIRDLYGRGLYVQALRAAEQFGPFRDWENTPARLLGGRLAIQLGGARLGRWLHLRAYRDTPSHPEAIYYHARYRLERFGPLAAWRYLRSHPDQDWNDAAPEVRADWYGLHAFVCGRLRDFDRAERWLAKALALSHDRAWLCVERAAVLEYADRPDDALASARRALELVPDFRPAVQAEAHLLQILGREEEAVERLIDSTSRIESGIVVAHLAALQMELRRYADARATYERYAELSPLRDEETEKWLAARRADVAYYSGDLAASREHAAKADEEFYAGFNERLASAAVPDTIRIDIPRPPIEVKGLSPLDTLAQFWSVPAPPAPADPPALDGLPDVRERLWALENGFAAVEFAATLPAMHLLLEKGVPFQLTLVDAGFSHSQIVVGVDRIRGSIWLTDSGERRTSEAPFPVIGERYASTGPRALALVPRAEAHRLDGLDLPDRDRYDRLHNLQMALHRHDRPAAVSQYEMMKGADPGHRVTRSGRLAVARYDANPTQILHAVDSLLALFPADNTFHLARLNVLRDLGRREDRTEHARLQCLRKDADPLFVHHYAQAVLPDPDRHPEVERMMRRAVRQRPYAPAGYYILANVIWEERRFQEATDLYRFAAALEDRDEQFAEAYFRAARVVEQVPEAIRFLTARFERTRGRVAGPARALFYALSEEGDMPAAFAALEAFAAASGSGTSRPGTRNSSEIGEVLLFAAESRTNYNEPETGKELMARAADLAPRPSWLRSAARQALVRTDLAEARRCWEEMLRRDPLAPDVHRNLSRAIADMDGRAAAIGWVRGLCQRFPFHYPVHQLLIDWLRGQQVGDGERSPAEPAIRHLIDLCPDDAWARRELALHLANHGRAAEAFEDLEVARRLEPNSPSYFFTFGHTLNRDDRPREAREAYEEAVRRSVDNEVAIVELFNLARGDEEKREVIDLVADELKRQRIYGDGLLVFREQAVQRHDALEPDDLMQILQDIFDEHSGLWQAWSTTVQQLTLVGRVEEARQLAREAVERYPLLSRLWVDLAEVCHAQDDREGQIRALRQAVQVAPGWSYAARELADAMEADDQAEDARVVLEQAVARSPLDPVNHGYLADNLWNAAGPDAADPAAFQAEAIERLRVALKMDPGYDWAWRHLGLWTDRLGEPAKALEVAREVCRLRPGDPRGWLALGRMLAGPGGNDEALAALDRAVALNPRGLEAYDLKAERLAEMGRYDEAKAAALPAVFENDPPMILQGRAAWVEARRGNLPVACREMQALVTLEPTYYWGWQQLAEWSNEANKPVDFLEAAEKLVDLRPDNPMALAMRGEARLQNDDREGAKEDLREAVHLEPGYSYPGMLLFDAHLQDEEYQQARGTLAVLEEHIADSGRPFVLARYAQLAARTKDEDAAAEAFEELLTLPCESTWPINSAATELREAGWADRVEDGFRKTIERAPDFHPFVLIAWLESKNGTEADPETRLRIVRRVTEVHPRYAQAYDVTAELLTRLGRHDEAIQACHPKAWGGQPPLILRGRAAWVLWQRGDRDGAIARMREIVAADPDYGWGWQQLATWYDETEAATEYLEATENLVRLGPTDPSAFGYRGEARSALGDHRGAKADFRRAFEIDPAYAFAGISLFDRQIGDNEIADAERTLALLEEHVGGPHILLRTVRLRCLKKDVAAARAAFETLLNTPDAPPFVVTKAAGTLVEAGYGNVIDDLVAGAIGPDTPQHVARLYVERAAGRGDWGFLDHLGENKAGPEVLLAVVDALGSPAHRNRLHAFLRTHGDRLRETHRGWGKAAVALGAVRDYEAVVTWAADWEKRKPDEPWMLHPLAVALRQLDRPDEAHRVCSYASELPAEDTTTPDFRGWMAFEEALAGHTDRAARLLEGVDAEDLDDVPHILWELTHTLIAVQRRGRAAFLEAKARGLKAVRSMTPKTPDPDLTLSFHRWARRLARDGGGFRGWFWATFRSRKLPTD